jgi:hypothetical protein
VSYFREPAINFVTIKATHIPVALAKEFDLVPQKHDSETNQWYKIVVMEHVEVEHLIQFLDKLKETLVIHS